MFFINSPPNRRRPSTLYELAAAAARADCVTAKLPMKGKEAVHTRLCRLRKVADGASQRPRCRDSLNQQAVMISGTRRLRDQSAVAARSVRAQRVFESPPFVADASAAFQSITSVLAGQSSAESFTTWRIGECSTQIASGHTVGSAEPLTRNQRCRFTCPTSRAVAIGKHNSGVQWPTSRMLPPPSPPARRLYRLLLAGAPANARVQNSQRSAGRAEGIVPCTPRSRAPRSSRRGARRCEYTAPRIRAALMVGLTHESRITLPTRRQKGLG